MRTKTSPTTNSINLSPFRRDLLLSALAVALAWFGLSSTALAVDQSPEAGQMLEKIEVSDGPTPFSRFLHTRVSDVAGFKAAPVQIKSKAGSATRQVKLRDA